MTITFHDNRAHEPEEPRFGQGAPTDNAGIQIPAFDSAATLLILGTVLALGGLLIPVAVRWVLWPLAMTVPGHAVVSATFGRHLDFGGFRRIGLSASITLTTYPLIGLTALVMGFRFSHLTVVIGTFLLVSGCAAIVHHRARSESSETLEQAPTEEPAEIGDLRVRPGELIVPGLAIGLSLLIVWASLDLFPRKPPDEYSSIKLDGTWALAAHAVPADPDQDVEVTFRIDNETTKRQTYVVTAAIVDGPEWISKMQILDPGEAWVDTVAGPIAEGRCRARLEIDMEIEGDLEDHFPLTVFFRDNTIDC